MVSIELWGYKKTTDEAQIPQAWREYDLHLVGSVCMFWVIGDEITNANIHLPPKTHILSHDHYLECCSIEFPWPLSPPQGQRKMAVHSWEHQVPLSFTKRAAGGKPAQSCEGTKHINFQWLFQWLEWGGMDGRTGTFFLENVASSTPVRFRVETLLKESQPLGRVSSEGSCVSRMKDKNNCFPQLHHPHWSKVM